MGCIVLKMECQSVGQNWHEMHFDSTHEKMVHERKIKMCLWNTDYAHGGNKVQKSYF